MSGDNGKAEQLIFKVTMEDKGIKVYLGAGHIPMLTYALMLTRMEIENLFLAQQMEKQKQDQPKIQLATSLIDRIRRK